MPERVSSVHAPQPRLVGQASAVHAQQSCFACARQVCVHTATICVACIACKPLVVCMQNITHGLLGADVP
eukprot:3139258-Rhodomonas_salina.1